jgi:hypothetical protein
MFDLLKMRRAGRRFMLAYWPAWSLVSANAGWPRSALCLAGIARPPTSLPALSATPT